MAPDDSNRGQDPKPFDRKEKKSEVRALHKPSQKPHKKPWSAKKANPYHPDFMFCGECVSCTDAPPPSFKKNLYATLQSDWEEGDSPNEFVDIDGNLNIEMTALDDSKSSISRNSESSRQSKFLIQSLVDRDNVLAVNALIQPLPGVSGVLTNIEKKLLVVDHDPFTTSASLISVTLTDQGYINDILWDAGSSIQNTSNPSGTCSSSLRILQGLCCNSEIPVLESVLEMIEGVKTKPKVNITTRMIYVEHDPFVVTVQEIAKKLETEGFPNRIKRDGAKQLSHQKQPGPTYSIETTNSTQSSFSQQRRYVESTLHVDYLSSMEHVQSMERVLKAFNSQKREETGKKRMIRAFHPHSGTKSIRVEHDATHVSALDLARLLSKDGGVGNVEVLDDGVVLGRYVNVENEYDIEEGMNDEVVKKKEEEESIMDGLTVNVILSGIFWFLSMLTLIGGPWEKLKYCGLLSVFFGIPPIAKKAYRTLRRCQFDANCMMLTAAFGALALGEFDEAASVAFLFAISEFLEGRATSRARTALREIINIRPDSANVVNEETREITIDIPTDRVKVGTLVSVRPGDKVPCDGTVVDGSSLLNESSLTGEARPVAKNERDEVFGGTINVGHSPLFVRTTSTVEDSAVSRLISLVEEAQANRSPTEALVDSFAKKYTPTVIFMATLMCTIPWAWGTEVGRYWALNGLIIIVVACPCALTISTPVTYSAGLAATAQQGVIVKGGARLEALGKVKKVVFDKTGTLTKGKFELSELNPIGDKYSREEILELLVIMEAPSSHPLSTTLIEAAKTEGVVVSNDLILKNHIILQGEGVRGFVNDCQVHVGNRRLFERLGYYEHLSEVDKFMVEKWNASGGTVGFVGKQDDGIIAAFCVIDTVRSEAREVISSMKENGMEVIMLTGDSEGAALHVGEQVGLHRNEVHFQLKPDDKLHFIGSLKGARTSSRWFQEPNLILMCGDGVNDAPALAVSDVGVAMGNGAQLALEMSDITVMDSNLKKLLYCIKMGERTIRAIKENIIFSMLAKTIVVGFTFAGWMTLFSAIVSDVGVMLIVTLNGMKLLPRKKINWESVIEKDLKKENILKRGTSSAEQLSLTTEGKTIPEIV